MRGPTPHSELPEKEKQWLMKIIPTSPDIVREIVGCVIEVGIKIVFGNFVYNFGGKFFLQAGGGPIGSRITMAAAQLVVEALLEKLTQIFDASNRVDGTGTVTSPVTSQETTTQHLPSGWIDVETSGRASSRMESTSTTSSTSKGPARWVGWHPPTRLPPYKKGGGGLPCGTGDTNTNIKVKTSTNAHFSQSDNTNLRASCRMDGQPTNLRASSWMDELDGDHGDSSTWLDNLTQLPPTPSTTVDGLEIGKARWWGWQPPTRPPPLSGWVGVCWT